MTDVMRYADDGGAFVADEIAAEILANTAPLSVHWPESLLEEGDRVTISMDGEPERDYVIVERVGDLYWLEEAA